MPKTRPNGVVDGKQVNIPVPPVRSDGVTEKDRSSVFWITRFKLVGLRNWQIRFFYSLRSEYERP